MIAEDRRQLVHVTMTLFVVPLPWLGETVPLPWLRITWALVMAGAAVLVAWVVLPLSGWGDGLRRAGDPFLDGVKLYPVAVLLCLAIFDPHVAAAAWAVMGLGDAASNLVGRRLGRPPFLGRRDRSLVGTLAFIVVAAPAATAAAYWVAPTDRADLWLPALAAAVAGALAELVPMPWRMDDNLPIALAAGAAFYVASG